MDAPIRQMVLPKEQRSDDPLSPNASCRCVFADHVRNYGLRDALTCWCWKYAREERAFDKANERGSTNA